MNKRKRKKQIKKLWLAGKKSIFHYYFKMWDTRNKKPFENLVYKETPFQTMFPKIDCYEGSEFKL